MQKNAYAGALSRSFSCLVVSCSALVFLLLDQISKLFFFDGLVNHQFAPFLFLNGWIQQTTHPNYGLTFDLPLPLVWILGASFVCIGWLVSRLIFSTQTRWRETRSLLYISLVLGGAIGNLADRIVLGFVRDWLLLGFLSAINIADICIGIGLLGLVIHFQGIQATNSKGQNKE